MFNGKWSGFVNGSSGWTQLKIIAWQPLPEPYKPTSVDTLTWKQNILQKFERVD